MAMENMASGQFGLSECDRVCQCAMYLTFFVLGSSCSAAEPERDSGKFVCIVGFADDLHVSILHSIKQVSAISNCTAAQTQRLPRFERFLVVHRVFLQFAVVPFLALPPGTC